MNTFLIEYFLEISELLASSKNYDELEYVWKQWHDKFNAMNSDVRKDYEKYIELSNKAAVYNGKIGNRFQ